MRRSAGFTLIEVLVALTLAAFVVLAAHRIFASVMEGVGRLGEERVALDREANARELLSSLVGSLDVDQLDAFRGEPDQVAFPTWVTDSLGRSARRRAVIRAEGGAMILTGVYAEPVVLADSVSTLALDYLLEMGARQRFLRRWYSEASAPAALRFRITRGARTDTLLLLAGWRG